MNALQHYLQNNGTLEELKEKFALNIKRHPKYNNLILFKYDQIDSRPKDHPLVVSARGLILDEADNYNPISWPFNRFFNYGEGDSVEIDWNTASVATKMDGSLMINYHYDNKWHIQSSGSPAADGEVNGFDITFEELFWQTFNKMKLELPNSPELNFIWELTGPKNRVVVNYPDEQLTLIGVRNRNTGEELSLDMFQDKYPVVKTYPLTNADEIIASLKDISPTSMEGYVVRSAARDEYGGFLRLKIKSPQYVNLHHIRDSWSARRMVEIVRNGEIAEIVLHFQEYAEQLNQTKEKYDALVNETNNLYEQLKTIEIQKDFALAVYANKVKLPAALFQLRAGKIDSVKQFIADMSIQNLMSILKIGEQECSHML